MVDSRPMRSDTQPKNGRVRPFVTRSKVSAKGSAAMPKMTTSATPNSRMTGANCDVTIRPPVDIIVIMTKSSQKSFVFSMSRGATSRTLDATLGAGATNSAGGACMKRPASAPTRPSTMPKVRSVEDEPDVRIIESMGKVVRIAPKP